MDIGRPYTNLKTYLEYKQRGVDALRKYEKDIASLGDDEPDAGEDAQ